MRNLSGRTGLPDLIALLRRVDAVLCNDTGILHLARALDVPLAVTAGPENHRLWGPYPIGRAPAVVLRREVPCAPCGRGSCTPHYCLRSLSPERVAEETGRLLDGDYPAQTAPGYTVHHDVSHLSWRQLEDRGFPLPLFSVLLVGSPGEQLDAAIEQMLDAVEPQTYPCIELIVAGECSTGWMDGRDERARRRLPLRHLAGGNADREEQLHAALRQTGGELITCFSPKSAPWWRERFAADVAAWLREPEADTYFDGIPHKKTGDLQHLLLQTVSVDRLRKWLAVPQTDRQRSPGPKSLRR